MIWLVPWYVGRGTTSWWWRWRWLAHEGGGWGATRRWWWWWSLPHQWHGSPWWVLAHQWSRWGTVTHTCNEKKHDSTHSVHLFAHGVEVHMLFCSILIFYSPTHSIKITQTLVILTNITDTLHYCVEIQYYYTRKRGGRRRRARGHVWLVSWGEEISRRRRPSWRQH